VGWAAGVERILLAAGEAEPDQGIDVFVAGTGPDAFALVAQLRSNGLRAQMEQAGRSLKGQLKQADRLGARWTVILGDGIEVKDMDTGDQQRAGSVEEVLGMVGA
jgi:histidyl-tRNA synthetase